MNKEIERQILSNQIKMMLHFDSFNDKPEFEDSIDASNKFFLEKSKEEPCCEMPERICGKCGDHLGVEQVCFCKEFGLDKQDGEKDE